jgi:gliding motility-associated-like protein
MTLNVVASSATACAGNSILLSGNNSGGSPIPIIGYNYNWVSGPASNTNIVSQSLGAAYIYTLNSSDVFNCSISKTIAVTFVPNPSITVANVSICPLQTATLSANGASTYTWNGFFVGGSFADNPLVSTQYSVIGFALGCTAAATASIILKSLPVPTLVTNSPRCNGDNLLLSGNGGVSYSWSGPLGYGSSTQNPILNTVGLNNAGVYNLTVTAANSCTASTNATVIVNPTPTLSAFGSTVCTIQTASLSANSVNGATYVWSGPLSFSSTQQSISIPSPSLSQSGVYNLTVTSVLGCSNTTSINVLVVAPPSLSIALSSTSICAQALSGSPNNIVLDANGASTYTLITPNHISNSNTSGPSSNLGLLPPYSMSGSATATLLGSNGVCVVSQTATFNVVPNPTLSAINPTPVICAGQSFTYTSSGASSYTWSSPNPSNYFYTMGNVAVVNPSINSVFSVVGGSLGCLSAMQISNITVNPLPVVNIVGNALICPGTSATLSAIGTGTSFTWSPSSFLNNSNYAVVLASPPTPQNYNVIASLNTCTTSAMLTVSVLPLTIARITTSQSFICQNENIVLSGLGGPMQMVAYLWQTPIGYTLSSKNLEIKALNSDFGGNYTLTVNDQNNCKASVTQSITVYNLPQGYLTSPTMQGCAPLCSDFNFKTTTSTAAISEISWQVENSKFDTKAFQYCFPLPGNYIITGDFSDIHNCVNTATALVNVYPKPKADFEFSPTQPVENLETVQFNNTSKGAEQYSWYFVNELNSSNKKDPTFLFEASGSYPVVLVAQNQWLCKDSIIKVIHVDPDFAVYVPNAFTPNDDGLNESFSPVLRGGKNFTFTVFDRWGKIVFESIDITKGWDGTFKGEPCPLGVYVWKLVVSSQSGLGPDSGTKSKSLSGEVMLYR